MSLVDHRGNPISYKKDPEPKMGQAFGDWAGRDTSWVQLPGGSILTFDLSRLTLADFRAMRPDPQINSSLTFLNFMLSGIDWWIDCEDKKVKTLIQDNLTEKWSQLTRSIGQAFWCGFAPTVIDYENDVGSRSILIKRFKDLLPEECEVNWKMVEGWAPPGGAKPKFKEYDGIRQNNGPSHPIPVENTFWYPLLMENGDYYGRKLLKAAFTPWYFSILIHLFANRYYERFGEPTPVGRYPENQTLMVAGESKSARDVMIDLLQSLRSRGVVALPSDRDADTNNFEYDIEYLESQMRGADFERYMMRLDEEKSLAMFTPLLMFRTGNVGSNALGVQHTQTMLWMMNALAGDLKEYIDAYIVERLRRLNFSQNGPRATWEFKKLGKENVETIRAMVTEGVRQGTMEPDVEELGKAVGITLKKSKPRITTPPPTDVEVDPRTVRDRPEDRKTKPQTAGETRQATREIAARISSQIERAFRANTFGTDAFRPTLGYQRRFTSALLADGFAAEEVQAIVEAFYSKAQAFLDSAISIPREDFNSPRELVAFFEKFLDGAVDELAG